MATARKKARLFVPVNESMLRVIGGEIMGRDPEGKSENVFARRWNSFFGVDVKTCVDTWNLLQVAVDDPELSGAKPCHLLWALLFLKQYGDEADMASKCGAVDEKTFRKWTKIFIRKIAYLISDVIVWENRKCKDIGSDCLVSVDGTDCAILRQHACPEAWHSHKFKGPGVRYEVAVCILTGDIVWVLGPFPCGDWPDIVIFRFALKYLLEDYERVEADDGYFGEDPTNVKVPGSMVHDQDPKQLIARTRVRRRHETVNKRLKQFKCLATVFRHDVTFHGACFQACAVLTQLQIKNGFPLFSVEDYSNSA